jgi:hypothetical protein
MEEAAAEALRASGTYLREHPGELDLVRVLPLKERDAEVWAGQMGQLLSPQVD